MESHVPPPRAVLGPPFDAFSLSPCKYDANAPLVFLACSLPPPQCWPLSGLVVLLGTDVKHHPQDALWSRKINALLVLRPVGSNIAVAQGGLQRGERKSNYPKVVLAVCRDPPRLACYWLSGHVCSRFGTSEPKP
jgi:hypothetical protein